LPDAPAEWGGTRRLGHGGGQAAGPERAAGGQSRRGYDVMVDIFLSYADEDRERAYRIAGLLEGNGWSVWWDRRIPAGTRWRAAIDEALGQMRCMVVLWSRHSVASQWVNEEAEQARAAGKLVPVLIDAVRPPIGFRELQVANLAGWDGAPHAPAFRQLVLDLEAILGKPDAPVAVDLAERYRPPAAPAGPRTGGAPAGAPAASPLPPVAGVAMRRWPIGVGLLLAAILAVAVTAAMSVANWQALFGRMAIAPAPFAPTASEFPDARKQAEAVAPAPQATPAPDPPTSPPSAPVTTAPPPPPASKPSERSKPPKVAAEREPRADRGSPPAAADARCADILQRAQLGEPLSADDRAFLQRSCR
jgi:TIR domain